MMQQLAARQSDIAALDIGKRGANDASNASSATDRGFNDIIRQASPDRKNDSDRRGRADDARTEASRAERVESIARQRKAEKSGKESQSTGHAVAVADPTKAQNKARAKEDAVDQLSKEQNADVDWLAYVDAVKSAEEKLAENAEAARDAELSDEEALLAQAMLALEEFDGEELSPEAMIKLEDASGKAFTTPVKSVIDAMMAQLSGQDGAEETASDELKGLAGVLLTMQKEGKISLDSDSVLTKLADALPDVGAAGKAGDLIAKALANAESDTGEQADEEKALLLSLLGNEISASKTSAKDGADKLAELSALTNEDAGEDSLSKLMQDMQQLSQSSADEVTEELSSKIVSLMPNASAEQQQNVKSALISGINEIQQQLAKGHEPGLDLKSLIQQAMAEANVTQTQSMMAQIEQQATQLHQVVNTTQQTMQQILTSQMVSADTVIQENNQVRSEAAKGHPGAENIDSKPVNITRAEGQQQLQEKIRWMVNSRNTLAEIRLDPPELGSMQVRVNMNGDAASVNFVVQSQQARDALSDAMPRLRDMLHEQGIELGESFVQQEQGGEGGDSTEGQSASGNGEYATTGEDDTEVREQPLTRQETGGIDFYA